MTAYDNIMIPILITDENGIITYKNRAAKRCIPSPRLKGNINNYLNKKMSSLRIRREVMRLEFVKNTESVFNRALIFPYRDGQEIWCFIAELLIYEPEELDGFIGRFEPVGKLFNDIAKETYADDKSLFVRYQRAYTDLICIVKSLNNENKLLRFAASDVISSLKTKTSELAHRYGFRMSFDAGLTELWNTCYLEFEAFASVYIQLLSLSVRLTDTTGCAVTVFASKQKLSLTVTSALPDKAKLQSSVITTDILCSLYPKELPNILLLDTTAKLYGYAFDAAVTDGRLALTVSAPLESAGAITLHQELPDIIIQSKFKRLEKRFYEYMDAMFLQI